MMDELSDAITAYHDKWTKLLEQVTNKDVFNALQPTAVAWKTADLEDFDERFRDLRELSDQVHMGWINERWLATLHLQNSALPLGISIVKLMQRRPESTDAVGLDHIDFLVPEHTELKAILAQEPTLKWTEEKNGEHCKWISIWFDDTEAKLRSDTVLDVCIDEMQDYRERLFGPRTV